MTTTTHVSNEDRESEKSAMNWAISSQSSLGEDAGSTTNAHGPERTMKQHECAASKVCKKCNIEKPLYEYYKTATGSLESGCKECKKTKGKVVYHSDPANKERYAQHKARYRLSSSYRERERCVEACWRIVSKDRLAPLEAAQAAKRRAQILKATPSWANLELIKEFYILAASVGYHVDHIIPLQGKTVCGLHVETNLQLLAPYDNMSKSNKLLDDIVYSTLKGVV
jgi:hypothetical protein